MKISTGLIYFIAAVLAVGLAAFSLGNAVGEKNAYMNLGLMLQGTTFNLDLNETELMNAAYEKIEPALNFSMNRVGQNNSCFTYTDNYDTIKIHGPMVDLRNARMYAPYRENVTSLRSDLRLVLDNGVVLRYCS